MPHHGLFLPLHLSCISHSHLPNQQMCANNPFPRTGHGILLLKWKKTSVFFITGLKSLKVGQLQGTGAITQWLTDTIGSLRAKKILALEECADRRVTNKQTLKRLKKKIKRRIILPVTTCGSMSNVSLTGSMVPLLKYLWQRESALPLTPTPGT